jgi:hypothetical protein
MRYLLFNVHAYLADSILQSPSNVPTKQREHIMVTGAARGQGAQCPTIPIGRQQAFHSSRFKMDKIMNGVFGIGVTYAS